MRHSSPVLRYHVDTSGGLSNSRQWENRPFRRQREDRAMAHEIEVYGDDDGFMLLGNSADILQALAELQIEENHTIDIGKAAILKNAHRAVKLFEIMQKHSGRWVKFTKDSAEKAQKYGLLRNKSTGNFMGGNRPSGQKRHQG